MVVVYLAALGTFIGIVALRGGPSVGDAYGVTKPATALADGDLHAAAHESVLPQPPGYALLTSPVRPRLSTAHRLAHVVRRARAAGDAAVLAVVRARRSWPPTAGTGPRPCSDSWRGWSSSFGCVSALAGVGGRRRARPRRCS